MPKLPLPARPLKPARPGDIITIPAAGIWWKVYRTGGLHPSTWDGLRWIGPARSRFDHHVSPLHAQDRGITYIASDGDAALAEFFQHTRTINRRMGAPFLAAIELGTPIEALDLAGVWPTYAGASQQISSGSHRVAREWARACYEDYPTIQALRYPSSMCGGQFCLAVFDRAAVDGRLPGSLKFNRALADPTAFAILDNEAARIGYLLL